MAFILLKLIDEIAVSGYIEVRYCKEQIQNYYFEID